MLFVWSFHLCLLSMCTPRYLTVDFCKTSSPYISKSALTCSADIVLATFNDNISLCSHILRFSNSEFITLFMSLTSLPNMFD